MEEKHKVNNNKKNKQQKTKKNKGNGSYSERVRAVWFCCALMLGFLQLICKASLIFKWNLELALPIILKERIIQSKSAEYGCLKIWARYELNIARTTASTSKFKY